MSMFKSRQAMREQKGNLRRICILGIKADGGMGKTYITPTFVEAL